MQKITKNSPSGRYRTTLSGYIFATKASEKILKQQYLPTCSYNMVNFGPLAAEICWRVCHPSKFQRVSRLSSVTARHSSSGRQPIFAVLNRGRHLYLAGRPSRWALAHILIIQLLLHVTLLTATDLLKGFAHLHT